MKNKRIGILTGGGDCPGLNAVIRAVVKAAIGSHGWEVTGFLDGYRGLVENWTIQLSEQSVSGLLTRGGTILGTNNRTNPFAYTYSKSGRDIPPENRVKDILLNIKKNHLDALVTVGGDGTQAGAQKLFELGVPIVGIPKTIDNDLGETDVTFGFDTAVSIVTEAVDRLHSTAESHHRVMLVETMGRYAGWIALRAGMAGGGDIILIPEIPYRLESVAEAIEARFNRGKEFSIVMVAEGAKPLGGEMVVQRRIETSPDPVRLGGVSTQIASALEERYGYEARVTILGYLQRGGTPTAYDRWLATRFGVKAVELIRDHKFGQMVCLRGTDIQSVPIKKAIRQLRRVDPAGNEIQDARATGVSFGD